MARVPFKYAQRLKTLSGANSSLSPRQARNSIALLQSSAIASGVLGVMILSTPAFAAATDNSCWGGTAGGGTSAAVAPEQPLRVFLQPR